MARMAGYQVVLFLLVTVAVILGLYFSGIWNCC